MRKGFPPVDGGRPPMPGDGGIKECLDYLEPVDALTEAIPALAICLKILADPEAA